MGWYLSPTLREPYTCESPCEHRDCAANRAQVAHLCHYCGQPIGRETRVYFEENMEPVHADCLEDHYDA